jgi:Tol biopolymer transport system component
LGNENAPGERIVSFEEGSIMGIAWSPSGDKIAVTQKRIGETVIYVYDLSAGILEEQIAGSSLLVEDWYPDSNVLLLSNNGWISGQQLREGIWTLNLENNRLDFIASGDHAALSPDGVTVAIIESTDTLMSISMVIPTTGEEKNILSKNGSELTASGISWSPDGNKLLFAMPESSGYRKDLYVLDVDTLSVTRFTEAGYNHSASWPPDAKVIAYIGSRLEWETSYLVLARVNQPNCSAALAGTQQAGFSAFSSLGAIAYSKGGDLFYITQEAISLLDPIHCS